MSALEEALKYSQKLNLDECEIVSVKKKVTTIRITDSEIFELKQNFDKSYGIRIIHDKKISSIQTTNEKEITKSIDIAFRNISFLKPNEFWKSLPNQINSKMNLDGVYDKNLTEISGSKVADLAQAMINSALDSKISLSGALHVVSETFEISNSNGLFLSDKGTYISGIINAEFTGQSEVSGIGHDCCRTLDKFLPEKIGNNAKEMCLRSLTPKRCEPGQYSIIFEPYSVGEILAFVLASNFNFKTFVEKKSCFSKTMNENIAVEGFSLTDNPHKPQGIGSKPFDDEGVQTKVMQLVDKGKFVNTYSNLFDSYKEGSKSSGNGLRPGTPLGRSSEAIPISLPHNLEVESGDHSTEDMIKDTKHGLIVGRLWYTYAVNPIKGDFSCTARSGIQIIENGEIISPGKPVRIIHNLTKFLKNISAIGKDKKNVIQWASLPSISPSIKVEKIKIIPI